MKILLLRLSSLGDIVLTEPILQKLKDKYPNSKIDYLTKEIFSEVVLSFQSKPDNILFWKNKIELIKNLRKEKYDLVIDLHGKLNTFLIKKLIRPKKIITYNKFRFLRWKIVKKITKKNIYSTLDLYASSLKKLGINDDLRFPKLLPGKKCTEVAKKIFSDYFLTKKKILIGIVPGATHNTKRYPVKKIVKLINNTPKHWNCHYVLLGSYREKELSVKIKRRAKKKVSDLCGATNIGSLIAFINLMDVMITNDSGPMHIAAALGKHQISMFGATHTNLGFRPLNEKAVIIQKNLKCQPCSLHGGKTCSKNHFKCMNSINSIEILSKLQEIINELVIVKT